MHQPNAILLPSMKRFALSLVAFAAITFWLSVEFRALLPIPHEAWVKGHWYWMLIGPGGLWGSLVLGAAATILANSAPFSVRKKLFVVSCVLFATEAVAIFLTLGSARWGIASYAIAVLGGRAALAATAVLALAHFSSLPGLRKIPEITVVLLIAFLVVSFVFAFARQDLPVQFTGDEPSYLAYTRSLLLDHDLQFTPRENAETNREFRLPPDNEPHIWRYKAMRGPYHFLGTCFALLPAYVFARIIDAPSEVIHGFMILVFAISTLLSGILASRICGRRIAGWLCALFIAFTLPCLGMSYQVYPEQFAGLLLLVAALLLWPPDLPRIAIDGTESTDGRNGGAAPISHFKGFIVLTLALALPWFHSKFAALSVLLGVAFLVRAHRWRLLPLVCSALYVLCGLYVFFRINHPLYPWVLLHQSPSRWHLYGFVGALTDSDNGLLTYCPWLLLLPLGITALRRRYGSCRLAVAPALPLIALYLVTASNEVWSNRGGAALRYFAPALPLLAGLIAAAFMELRTQLSRAAAALAFIVPYLAALLFLDEPTLVYAASPQRLRELLDKTISAISWRELFPHFAYQEFGVHVATATTQGLLTVACFAAISALFAFRRTRETFSFPAIPAGLCCLACLGAVCGSPNWTVTATRLFARECVTLSKSAKARRDSAKVAIASPEIDFPAAVKPVEIYSQRKVGDVTSIDFATTPTGIIAGIPERMRLPRGSYKVTLHCNAREQTPPTSAPLQLLAGDFEHGDPLSPRAIFAHVPFQNEIKSRTTPGRFELSARFDVPASAPRTSIFLERTAPYKFRLDSIALRPMPR